MSFSGFFKHFSLDLQIFNAFVIIEMGPQDSHETPEIGFEKKHHCCKAVNTLPNKKSLPEFLIGKVFIQEEEAVPEV